MSGLLAVVRLLCCERYCTVKEVLASIATLPPLTPQAWTLQVHGPTTARGKGKTKAPFASVLTM